MLQAPSPHREQATQFLPLAWLNVAAGHRAVERGLQLKLAGAIHVSVASKQRLCFEGYDGDAEGQQSLDYPFEVSDLFNGVTY